MPKQKEVYREGTIVKVFDGPTEIFRATAGKRGLRVLFDIPPPGIAKRESQEVESGSQADHGKAKPGLP